MVKIWNNPITDSTDWGGDSSTNNLPVSGEQVQAWIKQRLSNIKTDVQLEDFITNILEEKGIAADGGFVTLNTEQKIEAMKNFAAGLEVGGRPITYNVEKDAWVFAGNVIITRGLAVNTTIDEFDKVSVFEDIPIDGDSIKWNNGVLVATGGGSGSGSGGIDEDQLQKYLDDYNYVNKNWINEQKYATQQWVEDKKYLTEANLGDSFVTINTEQDIKAAKNFVGGLKVNGVPIIYDAEKDAWVFKGNLLVTGGGGFFSSLTSFDAFTVMDAIVCDEETIHINEDGKLEVIRTNSGGDGEGSISEITAEMIAEALGYTPYNPADFTKANLQSTLGIYDWALMPTKPTYKYSEIQDAPLTYNTTKDAWQLDGNLIVTGAAAFFTNLEGFDKLSLTSSLNVDGTTISNAGGILRVIGGGSSDGGITEVTKAMVLNALGYTPFDEDAFTKAQIKSTLGISNWALEASKPSYTYTEIDGTPTSLKSPYSLSWSGYSSGSYDGSAARSISIPSKLSQLEDNILDGYYLPLSGGTMSGNLIVERSSSMIAAHNTEDYIGLHNEYNCGLWYNQGTTTNGNKWLLAFNSKRSAGWFTVPMAIGTTVAQPSYMLYVNGSSRFAGSLTPESHLSYDIGSSSRAFVRTYTQYLDSPTSYNLRLCSAGTEVITITTAGNVRIGAPSGTSRATFDVTGDAFISGQLAHALTSDRRLKRNIRKFSAAKYLRSLGGVFEFEYIDEEVARDKYYKGTHLGFIYQNVKDSRLTGMCIERENGFGALNLLHSDYLALLGAAAIEHEDRIHTLERQIKALQKELKQLKSA